MRESKRKPKSAGGRGMAPFCDVRGPGVVSGGRRRRAGENGCQTEVREFFCNVVRFGKALEPKWRNLDRLEGVEEDLDHWGAGMWPADYCPSKLRMFRHIC